MKRLIKRIVFAVAVSAAICATVVAMAFTVSCNNGLSSNGKENAQRSKVDRSQRVTIDSQDYVDFTIEKFNAQTHKKEDLVATLGGRVYKYGNSGIKFNSMEGTVEINSDQGFYNGKTNCQIYGKFGFELAAASSDCLYLRRNPRSSGILLINNVSFKDDQIPDLAVCIPLYGYSRNRIEVSSIMNGFIVMPSGTYWYKQ